MITVDGSALADADLVVAMENGEPIHPHTFSQLFERIIANAGLRKIRLHDLRDTHASLALKAGVPVKVLSERLGHESPAFTLKQYAARPARDAGRGGGSDRAARGGQSVSGRLTSV